MKMLRQSRNVLNLAKQIRQYSAAPLAGRTYLAGAEAKTFPKFLPTARHDFPFVFNARNVKRCDVETFARDFRPTLDALLRDHGIVMIRGWEMYTEDDFSDFLHALNYKVMRTTPGVGEARNEVGLNVYSGRDDPPEVNVEPHQEHSYLEDYPHLFLVHCEDPVGVDCGGDYIVVNVKDVQRQIDPSVVEKFQRLGVRYYRQLPCNETVYQQCWRKTMKTLSRDVVERRLRQNGYKFEWNDHGTLEYWIDRPAMAEHFRTSERLWFNQITTQHWTFHGSHPRYADVGLGRRLNASQFPTNTYYGDGSDIDVDVVQHIREVTWDNAVGFRFRRGDVLIMDNMLIQHGRLAWTGKRKITVGCARYD